MRNRLLVAVLLALAAIIVSGCGGGGHSSLPATVDDLGAWLRDAGGCEGVETSVTRLPVRRSRRDDVAPANQRFDREAVVAGLVGCEGANGYISYFRFPSARARAAAVRGRDGLISNELFCTRGPELVVNDLLGHDDTAEFCKRLGFSIHQPTHVFSASAEHRHREEAIASRLFSRMTGYPPTSVYCESAGGLLEFRCGSFTGGEAADVTLAKGRRGRYTIKGCVGEGCASPAPPGPAVR